MAFDYKKEYKEFYLPPAKPVIVEIPKMNYISVRGKGNPNEENGEYQEALGLLYAIAYTLKMSHKGTYKISGYFEYVVPPLEGFWWQDTTKEINYSHIDTTISKDSFNWISVIRLPDFVTQSDFDWAIKEASKKKKKDFAKVVFFSYDEGLCVQCMHIGSYDNEPITVQAMRGFAIANGYEIAITPQKPHHEIYLSDPRKSAVEKLKTVIRHPIRKSESQKE